MDFRIPDWLRYEIREKWERLAANLPAVRKWINQQDPRIIVGVTCASVFILSVVIICLLIPGESVKKNEEYKQEWFYDLNTGKLFAAKAGLIPPIEAPSGPLPNGQPAGVRAYVFTYAYEPNESERFIGFLETFTAEAKSGQPKAGKLRGSSTRELIEEWGQGRLICRVEDDVWFPINSNEGRAIIEESSLPNEKGVRPYYCRPE